MVLHNIYFIVCIYMKKKIDMIDLGITPKLVINNHNM